MLLTAELSPDLFRDHFFLVLLFLPAAVSGTDIGRRRCCQLPSLPGNQCFHILRGRCSRCGRHRGTRHLRDLRRCVLWRKPVLCTDWLAGFTGLSLFLCFQLLLKKTLSHDCARSGGKPDLLSDIIR